MQTWVNESNFVVSYPFEIKLRKDGALGIITVWALHGEIWTEFSSRVLT
jgi:hypothetical protein